MALCIAYLCISSFSASFCKRNIIKIIMKIRFCELSSLGAPVFWGFFMALVVPFELFPLGCRWGLDPAETLGMGMGGSQQSSGGRAHPKPSRGAGTGSSAPHPDPRAVPVFWDILTFRWRTCSAFSAHQELQLSWILLSLNSALAQTPLTLQNCSSHPFPSAL